VGKTEEELSELRETRKRGKPSEQGYEWNIVRTEDK
jgi:hypothetical protein